MPYSSDKLYNEVIRKMMARLASDVKARELMPHLSCLTLTDKEEIEAKRETVGNYNAMMLLVENLRRRENWPEQFISALLNCEHRALADEIQTKYDEIRGINTSTASAPVPAAASGIMPASPPAPVAAALASTQPTAGGLAKVTTATVHYVPKIVKEAKQSTVPALITLPSSLKAAPVESPDFVSVPEVIVPEPEHPVKQPLSFSTTQSELSVNSVVTPLLGPSDGRTPTAPRQTSFDAPLHPALPVTTSAFQFTTCQLPGSPKSSKVSVAVMENTSLSKHPIQDTRPPENDFEQVSQNSSSINQHLERPETVLPSNIQTRTSFQETSWVSSATNFNDASFAPQDAANLEEYLSKPEVLREQQSMSISSVNLEISHVNYAVVTTERPAMPVPVSIPQRAANYDPRVVTSESLMTSLSSRGQDSVSYLVAEEGLDLNVFGGSSNQNHEFPERLAYVLPNQPEENHYESVTAGLQGEPGTLENIVRYSEIPCIPNNSQPPGADGIVLESLLQVQTSENTGGTSDQSACAVMVSNVSQETKLNALGQINAPLSEDGVGHQSLLSRLPTDSRLIVAAAVGMTAVFLAWKMNH